MREHDAAWGLLVVAAGVVAVGAGACTYEPTGGTSPATTTTNTAGAAGGGAMGGTGGQGGAIGGTGGMGGAMGGAGGSTGGTGSDGGAGGQPTVPTLVDEGLVVRYFIDEAASGQGPVTVVDHAPDPLSLAISYAPELAYAQAPDGNRGLEWTSAATTARASAAIDGTKVMDILQGGHVVTVEVVAEVTAINDTGWGRLVHIGDSSSPCALCLAAASPTRVLVALSGGMARAIWEVDYPGTGLSVLHAVLDTTLADADERAKLYWNGARLPRIGGSGVAQDEPLSFDTGQFLALGNRQEGDRGTAGRIAYAALYAGALTEEQILQNTGVLIEHDDAPP